jgi:ketosteroid isomerase-like protein
MKWSLNTMIFCLFFLPSMSFSQTENIQEEINQDVWFPFMDSYASFDDKAFMDIHTEDIIRVIRDAQRIQVGAEYAEAMARSAKSNIERKRKRTIDFSFLERFASKDTAFEVGYYRVLSSEPGKETKTYYGIFQVVLKKKDGKWKILVDSDTSMDDSLTEEDFKKGKILER